MKRMESKTKKDWKEWKDGYEHFLNFLRSDSADSEIIGDVIILSITVIAVLSILVYSLPMIGDLKSNTVLKNAEQAFMVVDSRASRAVFGDSGMQTIDVNLNGGSLSVMPNGTGRESYVAIKSNNNTFEMVIPMGKLLYKLGNREVAYEGGGVWSKYPSGSVMLSPPEFHYSGVTLTLPEVNITGSDSQGGKGVVTVNIGKGVTDILFPLGGNRSNPLNYSIVGKIYINITSDYYDAWAEYARSLSYTRVVANRINKTAEIELTIIPNTFGMPTSISNPISMRGVPKHKKPLKNFSFEIYSFYNFREFDWDIRAKSKNKELIFHIFKNTLNIGYKQSGKDGETWGTVVYPIQTDEIGDYIDIDLLSNTTSITYSNQNVGSDNAKNCQPFGSKISGISNPDFSWDDLIINTTNQNKTQSLYNVTQHYISMLAQDGEINLYQCSPANKHDPEHPSTVTIDYDAEGDITFLYVTDNRVKIGIN